MMFSQTNWIVQKNRFLTGKANIFVPVVVVEDVEFVLRNDSTRHFLQLFEEARSIRVDHIVFQGVSFLKWNKLFDENFDRF